MMAPLMPTQADAVSTTPSDRSTRQRDDAVSQVDGSELTAHQNGKSSSSSTSSATVS